jgi:hypothetical protein
LSSPELGETFTDLPPPDFNARHDMHSSRGAGRIDLTEKAAGSLGSRTKLKIRLSQDEFAESRRAVSESEFPNLALFAFQALAEGLDDDDFTRVERKRTRTLSIHISKEFQEKIRRRAEI